MTGDMSARRRQRLAMAKTYARERGANRKKAKMFADYYNLRWRRDVDEPPFGSVWDSWPRKDET